MPTIRPFCALRPKPELAPRICELPYDVMSSAEARALAAGNPLSFLHVSKPEIDLPPETDLYDPAGAYDDARARLTSQGFVKRTESDFHGPRVEMYTRTAGAERLAQ